MTDALASALNPAIDDARLLCRGASRLLYDLGYNAIPEFSLASNRRADLFAISKKGEIAIVEVKSGIADFRADNKWPEYRDYCDRLYFAVSNRFPHDLIPDEAGLIIADGFGAAVVRESPHEPLAAARRKAVTLRFARCAAERLMRIDLSQG
ncbi:MmcB family DNA repair protein [Hyphobacterium marinum]|uniref:MmcB family DNA repair protein n=1 Tax=Hyphobacterium marinum TaxID=3116574 RepID=A0ABU7LVM2_9PROT|nr:MmcB family DNA repair protein [Hyphobacterium sp. Y6023]MEE2565601.1 MmcB family DNA repair protein [Hyphobacterium sp. Y6023]